MYGQRDEKNTSERPPKGGVAEGGRRQGAEEEEARHTDWVGRQGWKLLSYRQCPPLTSEPVVLLAQFF